MERSAVQTLNTTQQRLIELSQQAALIVGGSLFVALCARVTISLMPLTPVPLTVQNFGVLLVGFLLGSRRGFAAMALYLVEGGMGLPVFSPAGVGGTTQLFGVTGGFLLAYPLVAFFAGYIWERGHKNYLRAMVAASLAEVLLFVSGLSWLYIFTHSFAKAAYVGLYFFVAAEVMKTMFASAIAIRWSRAN